MTNTYKFRCAMIGHKSDVRCLHCFSTDLFISGSRDVTARAWRLSGCESHQEAILLGHENYVSAVTVAPAESDSEDHMIFTGSHDKCIRAYHYPKSFEQHQRQLQPAFILKEHSDTVCTLASDLKGTLISGSWDKTIRFWRQKNCVLTLNGHDSAVWFVLVLSTSLGNPDDLDIVSCSADKSIRLWRVSNLYGQGDASYVTVSTLHGHTDCVRALTMVGAHSNARLLSAGNDASIRAWDLKTGRCIGEFYGHTSFIYALACRENSKIFISSGEDRCVRVWPVPADDQWGEGRQFAQIQSIPLPCQSGWCTALTGLDDIIVGCSDGVIRLFSAATNRQASEDGLKVYASELASAQIAVPDAQNTGDFDLKQLPGPEALAIEGKKEGQVMVVLDEGRPVCYQWSMGEYQWQVIGDVVGTGSTKLPIYEGKEYDFVFTVDIAEGQPALKLPYNRADDPWLVAHNFIQKHDLSADYLDTVAKFIIQNAGPSTAPSFQSEFVDPFTGADRYIPNGTSTSGSVFPKLSQQVNCSDYFPSTQFVSLKSVSLAPLINKLVLFNQNQTEACFSSDELNRIRNFTFDIDESAALSVTSSIVNILPHWPTDKIFPLLDLLRCLVFWPDCSRLIFASDTWKYIYDGSLNYSTEQPPSPANCLLALRLVSNAVSSDGSKLIENKCMSVVENVVAPSLSIVTNLTKVPDQILHAENLDISKQKQHQIALTAFLHNLVVLAYCPVAKQTLPHLRFVPVGVLRTALYFLSLAPTRGVGGVTLFHPEAICNTALCMGTAVICATSNLASKADDQLKVERVRILASAATAALPSDSGTMSELEAENELASWDRARAIMKYWIDSPTASAQVRKSISALLSLFE